MKKSTKMVTGNRRFYQPELDALRFFAFLGVLFHHKSTPEQLHFLKHASAFMVSAIWAAHSVGAFGVQLFFLLSSYLITRLLLMEVDTTGTLNLKAFYMRRSLRIWPLYFFFLLLCFVLSRLSHIAVPGGFFLSAIFFVSNWYLGNHFLWIPLLLLWTLSIEEQFYLCWPILMRSGKRSIVRTVGYVSIAITQVAAIWLMLSPHLPHPYAEHSRVFYNTFAEVQFFGLGALLALWAERKPVALSRSRRLLLATLGVAALVAASLFDPEHVSLSAGATSYVVMLNLAAFGVTAIFRSVVGISARWFPAWLLFLGKISYGLYIFNLFTVYYVVTLNHGRIPKPLELPIVFVVNVALAVASHFAIEKPFLALKSRFEIVRSRPVNTSAV
ncbi:acyltransferase [Granulicella sp. L60]|jgi:peptidoglycan/LPS O-acetylase OafA/YrhL|uniref:acyltransferase family protein n=1 Tax=Granulicella sp. L60 TaxID=1641866 RepID=UPI00131CA482|nr:acyltransferase [Granulicella sp. L60]